MKDILKSIAITAVALIVAQAVVNRVPGVKKLVG